MVSQVEMNAVSQTYETNETRKASNVSGRTIGEPKLSEKASKYYEELKKKFSNMDFILVSKDQKETAKAQASSYANANHMVVLIDEEKVEKMASDEQYRTKYENIIQQAGTQMPRLQSTLGATSSKVKTFGIQVNDDGTASFFAVLKKNGEKHVKRMTEKAAEKRKVKKAEEKKAAQKELAEKIQERNQKNHTKSDGVHSDNITRDYEFTTNDAFWDDSSDTITISSNSIDGLIQKIKDMECDDLCNQVQTQKEKQVGQHIDYRM